MYTNDLKELSKQLDKIMDEIDRITNEIDELTETKKVKKYKYLQKELKNLTIVKNNLENTYQYNCRHPLWYLENMEHCREGHLTYWECRCVACGMTKQGLPDEFDNVVTSLYEAIPNNRYTYEEVKKEYNELDNTNKIEKQLIGKVLVKKFKNK